MEKYFYLTLRDYFDFLKITFIRTKSEENYFNFQKKQGEFLIKYLRNLGFNLQNYYVLDLANGYGGGTFELISCAKEVIGLDMFKHTEFFPNNQVLGDALATPFKENSFDLIICASLIEHLENPELLLLEIKKILKPNCFLYLSFPPFYSINGGHDYIPFHVFGEKLAVLFSRFFSKIFNRKRFGKKITISESFKTAHGDWGLYKMSIRRARNLIHGANFEIIDQSTKWIPINFSKLPILNEVLTWHVQFLLKNE